MSAQQIIFFEKNKIDLERTAVQLSVTDLTATNDGADYLDYMRDRKNYTGWMTTGSNDAANTVIDVSFGDTIAIDNILLVGHNLKSYRIQYLSGASYVDFSTAINTTTDAASTTRWSFSEVNTTAIRLTIYGTQVANADKMIKQFIVTSLMGQLQGWPQIKSPTISTNKRKNKMLSGKFHVVESLESFSCKLAVAEWRIQADIDIILDIYDKKQGVLMWINAGSTDQFYLNLKGYRAEDIYLVRPTDDWQPDLNRGVYQAGVRVNIDFAEVIT